MQGDGLSPVARYVRSLGGFYMISEVADALDVGQQKLRHMAGRDRRLGPSAKTNYAGTQVWLYTADDVTRIQEHLADKPKRKRLWTTAEYKDRQRRDRLVRYYKSRAQLLADAGKANRAAACRRKAHRLAEQLERERARRERQKRG